MSPAAVATNVSHIMYYIRNVKYVSLNKFNFMYKVKKKIPKQQKHVLNMLTQD